MLKGMSHSDYMQSALALARRGEYTARPNPMVGCILVKNNQIIGEGLHWQAGNSHAEVNALIQAGENVRGATCYITLEPCGHQGRTPPCVEALITHGVETVVIATSDPNPLVAGSSIERLLKANVKVIKGVLEKEAIALNLGFFSRMIRKRPYVRAKIGMSLDGKVAMQSGESQWITSASSRAKAHDWRARSGAILTGSQTVIRDNCRLNVRDFSEKNLPEGIQFQQPLRFVIDSQLKTSPMSAIYQGTNTVVAISSENKPEQVNAWKKRANKHVKCIALPIRGNHVDIKCALNWLGENEVNDVLVEAGPILTGAFLQEGLIDELIVFVAPKLLGSDALGMSCLPGMINLDEHIRGNFSEVMQLGEDLYVNIKLGDFFGSNYDVK